MPIQGNILAGRHRQAGLSLIPESETQVLIVNNNTGETVFKLPIDTTISRLHNLCDGYLALLARETGHCPVGLDKEMCFCCTYSKDSLCDFPNAIRPYNQQAIELCYIKRLAAQVGYQMPELKTITMDQITELRVAVEIQAQK